ARADSRTRPVAQAERAVTSLPDTSTIRAWPALSTCVSPEPAFSLVTAGPAPRRCRPRSSARPTLAPRPARWPCPAWLSGANPARSAGLPSRPPGRARSQEGAPAGRRAQRPGQLGLYLLQAELVVALQRADRGPGEDLERHIGADRVAGQREDRHPVA